jgi:TonB-linked SusC/RagA family outer membrane protein
MKRLLLLLIVFCSFLPAMVAQQKAITGIVKATEDGLPIIGATVQVKGTTLGTSTDVNGKYQLLVPDGSVLEFRYVGMKNKEVIVGTSNTVDVTLDYDLLGVDEVVVVAYGVTKKESYTGAASVVKSDALSKTPTISIAKALQANAAGVQVVNTSGSSTAEPTIRIRGIGSITASSDPLWVVDGVVGATQPNINDIETITVLKDAASSSLYGSRAANGVIMVTTKRGTSGKTIFSYSGKQSYQWRTTNNFQMLNSGEFFQKEWEGLYNYRINGGSTAAVAATYANTNVVARAGKNPFDISNPIADDGSVKPEAKLMMDESWFDLAHRTGSIMEHNLSASGGDEKTKFYFSGTYYNLKAITKPDELKKMMGHINVTSQVGKNVKVGYTATMNYQMGNTVKNITNGSGTGYSAYAYPNNVPLYELDANFKPKLDVNGVPLWNWFNLVSKDYNPIAQTILDPRDNRSSSVFNSINLNWTLIKDLVFDTKVSGRLTNFNSDEFRNPFHGDGKAYGGSSDKNQNDTRMYMTTSTLTYNKNLFSNHTLNFLVGYETEYYIQKTLNASGQGYDVPFSDELSIAAKPFGIGSGTTENAMISYLSRLNYSIADKYYISGSYRRDGSSRFSPTTRYADFWSVSGSWRINQESFLSGISWLNDLKIRASYGTSGNQAIPEYAYYPTFGLGSVYNYNVGMTHNSLSNYGLTWEKNKETNIGIEFGIFNKLRGTVEYFDRNTDGLLLDRPLSPSVGFTSKLENIGGMNNRGFEVELRSTNITATNFIWLTDFNISHYKNKITALSQPEIINNNKRWVVGNSLYEWYLREYAGVDPADGKATWYKDVLDAGGNPTGERVITKNYSESSRYQLGKSIPDYYGSITNTFTLFKDISLSFQLYWSLGGKIYNTLMQQTMTDGSKYGLQLNKKVLDSWKKPGDITDVPQFVYSNSTQSSATSSRFLEDGSFMRVRNINLTYSLPKTLATKIKLEGASVFINGDNLFVLTKFQGNDPEQGLSGTSATNLVPNVRTLTFGVNISF